MYAVIEISGKQHLVQPGQVIRTLRVVGDAGDELNADRVLAVLDGERVELGRPSVEGARAVLQVVRHARSPKLRILTYQPKKRRVRRMGYRENISYLRVARVEE